MRGQLADLKMQEVWCLLPKASTSQPGWVRLCPLHLSTCFTLYLYHLTRFSQQLSNRLYYHMSTERETEAQRRWNLIIYCTPNLIPTKVLSYCPVHSPRWFYQLRHQPSPWPSSLCPATLATPALGASSSGSTSLPTTSQTHQAWLWVLLLFHCAPP